MFRERGFAGALAWDPGPSSERGPSLTLRHTVGARASGGVEALLRPGAARILGDAGDRADALERHALEAQLGYGFALFAGRWTGTPSVALGLTESERETVLGWRLVEAAGNRMARGVVHGGLRRSPCRPAR